MKFMKSLIAHSALALAGLLVIPSFSMAVEQPNLPSVATKQVAPRPPGVHGGVVFGRGQGFGWNALNDAKFMAEADLAQQQAAVRRTFAGKRVTFLWPARPFYVHNANYAYYELHLNYTVQ